MGSHRAPFVLVMLALVGSAIIVAPADLYAAKRSHPTAVAISEFKDVAGRWSGILYGRPGGTREQDWVELTIREDGAYTLASVRTIGVLNSSGTLRLADGRLIAQGEKAQVTITRYQGNGKQFLRVEGAMTSGQPLRADLYAT